MDRKKRKKKALISLLCIPLAILLLPLSVVFIVHPIQEVYWKHYSFNYVEKHQEELNEYVQRFSLDTPRQRVEYGRFIVINEKTKDKDHYIVQFNIKNAQFGLSWTYLGMYYSPEDSPAVFLTQTGGHGVETEKICDHWYWFKETY